MMGRTSLVSMLLSLVMLGNSYAEDKLPLLKGPYLGQEPPGLEPEVFAPGIISTDAWEVSGVFSPDMNEFYYIREVGIAKNKLQQQFVLFENQKGSWHRTVISPRVGQPFISPDGMTMHLGRRYKERTARGWSDIKKLGEPYDSLPIMRLTVSARGTYVFDEASQDSNSVLRYSQLIDGKREQPRPFPKQINTGQWNAHPFIAPDESYLIWDGQRGSEVRNADLFVSFRQPDGSWGEAIKMGDEINTAASEGGARVTPDGKYLFFGRNVGSFDWTHENGEVETIPNVDIFWVSAQVIEDLRPKANGQARESVGR